MNIILALIIGGLFGFVLDRIGATNPNNIINMLRLRDLTLMKIIVGAIGFASVGLFGGIELGLIDVAHLSVKSAYVGVVAGGALLGIGFALAGYCPGTGLGALASGRKDALYFVIGGLVGALLFTLHYAELKGTVLFDKIAGGKVTLGLIEGSKYASVFENIDGSTVGLILGALFLIVAFFLPRQGLK